MCDREESMEKESTQDPGRDPKCAQKEWLHVFRCDEGEQDMRMIVKVTMSVRVRAKGASLCGDGYTSSSMYSSLADHARDG